PEGRQGAHLCGSGPTPDFALPQLPPHPPFQIRRRSVHVGGATPDQPKLNCPSALSTQPRRFSSGPPAGWSADPIGEKPLSRRIVLQRSGSSSKTKGSCTHATAPDSRSFCC